MNTTRFFILSVLVAVIILIPSSVTYAENWADKVELKGFASFVYHRTNEVEYYNGDANSSGIDNKGSFKGTRLGINLNAIINSRITLASQLYSSAENDYAMSLDWAFIGINLSDPLTLRLGKVKYPVGIVNEYRDVGFALPWISAPESVYSLEAPDGPQATREAFSGASLLWTQRNAEFVYSVDLFAGEVGLSDSDVRELTGLTFKIDWDDKIMFQASQYEGTMYNASSMPAMNGQPHKATVFGIKIDWNNYVFYSETVDVEMGTLVAMKADSMYATFGYRFGKLLTHITTQNFEQGQVDDDQTINKLGFRYDIYPDTALKLEIGKIETDKGQGLFNGVPGKNSVNIYGLSVDVVF